MRKMWVEALIDILKNKQVTKMFRWYITFPKLGIHKRRKTWHIKWNMNSISWCSFWTYHNFVLLSLHKKSISFLLYYKINLSSRFSNHDDIKLFGLLTCHGEVMNKLILFTKILLYIFISHVQNLLIAKKEFK